MHINPAQLSDIKPLRSTGPASEAEQVESARDLKKAFGDFVGKTFYGQMLKSMRATVDKPAYFHGGHAEEVFRSQLDQVMADELSDASADRFADPMFQQQFPRQAALLERAEGRSQGSLQDLSALRRR